MKEVEKELIAVNEAIEYAEINDQTFTKDYANLKRRRRRLRRAVKKANKGA